jgi:Ca2+-binding EF-hand superfamily protein
VIAWVALAGFQPLPFSPPLPLDVQDLLWLADKGPVRIRLHATINGQPYQKSWEEFLSRLFAYADVKGDKSLTKDEAERLPQPQVLLQMLRGQFFFIPPNSHINAPFDQLDANKDGKVTLEEMKSYYRRSGFAPMQIDPDPDPSLAQTLTDALFKHLDRDKDGKLSREELQNAETVLLRLDLNEDEKVSFGELIPGFDSGFGRRFGPPGGATPKVPLVVINHQEPLKKQAAAIVAHYDKDKDGSLSPNEIGFDKAMFDALDANNDGKLDANELARWLGQGPDLELTMPLLGPKVPREFIPLAMAFFPPVKEPALAICPPSGHRAVPLSSLASKRDDNVLVLTMDKTLVHFTADRNSLRRFFQFKEIITEEFKSALRNKKTYLEKKETNRLRLLRGLFPVLDRDGDGKLTELELNAFLNLLSSGQSCYLAIALSDQGACLFDLLDTNHDRHLGLRELRGAWKSVAVWDADHDGVLSKQEVPRLLRVRLSAGTASRFRVFDDDDETMKPVASRSSSGPIWFRKMDVNGDGDVSRREWLGSEEDFRRIDTDGDGLISLEEAIRADDWMRKKVQTGR